jgi:prepilin-type N-terminal cleavage/methylation domain-containing protein
MRSAATMREDGHRGVPCRGFTVIEVIVASFLLTVGLLATSQLVIMATGHIALSRQQSDAASLAAQTVEQYRDINYTTLGQGCSPSCTYTAYPVVGAITYTVQTAITPDDPAVGMKRVAVSVTWGGGNSYATSTILSPLQ